MQLSPNTSTLRKLENLEKGVDETFGFKGRYPLKTHRFSSVCLPTWPSEQFRRRFDFESTKIWSALWMGTFLLGFLIFLSFSRFSLVCFFFLGILGRTSPSLKILFPVLPRFCGHRPTACPLSTLYLLSVNSTNAFYFYVFNCTGIYSNCNEWIIRDVLQASSSDWHGRASTIFYNSWNSCSDWIMEFRTGKILGNTFLFVCL